MTIKEKIRQYIGFKGVSQRQFSFKTNLSEGIIKGKGSIGSDKLIHIRNNFPDLNMNWLVYDEGDMIIDPNKVSKNNSSNVSEDDYALLKKALSHALISYDEIKEELDRLKKQSE